jgi:hypothetical protein
LLATAYQGLQGINDTPTPEIARVLVRFDHVASGIVNTDQSVM